MIYDKNKRSIQTAPPCGSFMLMAETTVIVTCKSSNFWTDAVFCHTQVRSPISATTQAAAAGFPDLTNSRDTSADTQVRHVSTLQNTPGQKAVMWL